MIRNEKIRRRDNQEAVYYQEITLHGSYLKFVYVKDDGRLVDPISSHLKDKRYSRIRVLRG